MAQSIVFNNATYIIPDVGESNWGQNLTNYFVAIPQGVFQLSGGTSPLTADLSFGSNFGIFAKYFTSVTTTPATAGAVRLAKTDALEWRNNANSADLALAIDSSNNLTFNGHILTPSGAGPVLSITGTTNQITASAATGNVTLSIPSPFVAPGSIGGTTAALSATSSQIVLGTTNTTTLSATAPAASRVYTLPDAGGSANVVLDTGNYTIGGTWAFSNTITFASSKGIIFTDNSTNAVTMKATNATTSWNFNLPPTKGTGGQFMQTDGNGNTSWQNGGSGSVGTGTAGRLTLYGATGTAVTDTYVQNVHNITLAIATQGSRSADLALTIPNPGNAVTAANVVLDQGAYTIAGAWTHSATLTMSGATIAMGSNKITGVASASTAGDALAYGQSGASLAGLALASNKLTGVANGTVSTDGAAFGQVPVITNWTGYTPTIVGFGTAVNLSFRWKQIGDTIYVSGVFQAGTVTATIGSISLPNSFTILYGASGMSTNQDLIGLWQSSKTELTTANSDAGGMITDGTTTTTVFFSRSGSTGAVFPTTSANAVAGTSNYIEMNFWFIHA